MVTDIHNFQIRAWSGLSKRMKDKTGARRYINGPACDSGGGGLVVVKTVCCEILCSRWPWTAMTESSLWNTDLLGTGYIFSKYAHNIRFVFYIKLVPTGLGLTTFALHLNIISLHLTFSYKHTIGVNVTEVVIIDSRLRF